jgi:hypothetical protein
LSSSPEREALILEAIERAYREDGYEVITHPGHTLLPPIFDGFRPDAIALKDADKIAIEVVSGRSPASKARIDALQTRFADQSEWRLQLVHTGPPGEPVRELPQFSSIFSAAMKASCGISTLPNWRIFFLPSFCLSSSLRLREMSPP